MLSRASRVGLSSEDEVSCLLPSPSLHCPGWGCTWLWDSTWQESKALPQG